MTLSKFSFYTLFIVSFAAITSCKPNQQKMSKQTMELNQGWAFAELNSETWMAAKVPGTVHGDLQTNKVIESPYYRDNGKEQTWIEGKDWVYKTKFEVSDLQMDQDNVALIFEGLDTYADVYLNDSLIKTTNNMFVAWEIPCKKHLIIGTNHLKIVFKSALNITMAQLKANKYLIPCANEYAEFDARSNVYARKAPYHWGWDWGPRIVTCGIWKPIYLQTWNQAKVNDVFYAPKNITKEKASYTAKVEIESDEDVTLDVVVNVNKKMAITKNVTLKKGENNIVIDFDIENPELWWSYGLGKPYLYEIETQLKNGAKLVDSKMRKTGVRKLELVTTPDGDGNNFLFKLNDHPVFIKGTNYIPSDNLIPEVTPERYLKIIKATTDANMNMLRVWGGAIYENDLFYDLCDENGILVWQDFMFACSMVPNIPSHLENIKLEVDYNVKRLRNHASLALWCGNNENMVAWQGWDWQKIFKLNPSDSTEIIETYKKVFHDMIPKAIDSLDGTHAYWPTSPGSSTRFEDGAKNTAGDVHDWWIWFGKATFKELVNSKKRFISEYGLQSFPEMKTIKSFAVEKDFAYNSDLFNYKQRSMMPWIGKNKKGEIFNGNDMINTYIGMYYKQPKDFENFVYLSQLTQAEGLKYIIKGHRSHKPYCWGSMYWQIDDCWPTVSWSTIDYYYRWKAAHYFVRDAYKQVVVNATTDSLKNVVLELLSDELHDVIGELQYTLTDFAGKEISKQTMEITVSANESKVVAKVPMKELLKNANPKNTLLQVAFISDNKLVDSDILYFDLMKNLVLPKPTISKTFKATTNGVEITLTSDVLAKNVYISSEKFDGFFSNNYVDIIPGKPQVITFDGTKDAEALKSDLKVMNVRESY